MKQLRLHRLEAFFRVPPKLTFLDLALTVIPLVLWLTGLQLRPHLIELYCIDEPQRCDRAHLIWPDSIVPDFKSHEAHHYSNQTQLAAGVFPAVGLVGLHAFRVLKVGISPAVALAQLGTDFVVVVQAVLWNGFFTEATKIYTQRLRPHSYLQPHIDGQNVAHYTSFYSGHTSFTAAAGLAFLLVLLGRGLQNTIAWRSSIIVVLALTVATATLRILGGRHFFSDVIVGAIAGWTVAIVVATFHRPWKTLFAVERIKAARS